jgi:hypothetical protein
MKSMEAKKSAGATDFEKLWSKVSSAPANTDFATLVKLMEFAGFELRMGKKQHAIFVHRTHHKLQNVAKPHHGPVKPVYVRECLKTIRELWGLQEKPDD